MGYWAFLPGTAPLHPTFTPQVLKILFLAVEANRCLSPFLNGTLDSTGKIRTDTGYVDDVVTGERIKLKGITTLVNNDTYMYEMFQTDRRGNEIKYMEITYTRKK